MLRAIALALAITTAAAGGAAAEQRRLPISPVMQQTPVWCWAAVAEMVLRYSGYPALNTASYQCGIVATLGGPCAHNCGFPPCITGIGNTHNFARVLEAYPQVARMLTGRDFDDLAVELADRLSFDDIADEIDAGRPVVAGISPGGLAPFLPDGISEHVALIIGYAVRGERGYLIVNDPMPVQAIGFDPYLHAGARMLRPGQYEVSYRDFVIRLGYKDTLLGLERY